MVKTYCVYKHTSPSGKVYIGITKQSLNMRWKNGFGYESSPHFWNAIQKYGWDSFDHEIVYDGLSEEHACFLEQDLIKRYKATDRRYGYNQKSGGEKGSKLNNEVRQRMSENMKKYYLEHPEAKEIQSKKAKGFHHSNESKLKMSEAAKRRHYTLTDEWKRKIGYANKARLSTDKNLYEETCLRCRENGKKRQKKVNQFSLTGEFITCFENAHAAERDTGIKNGNISACCRGIKKTAGGYKWQYANENITAVGKSL